MSLSEGTPNHPPRVYANQGNPRLLALNGNGDWGRVLDVGCGAGDNATSLRREFSPVSVEGITHSKAEAQIAAEHLDRCWTFDIERAFPAEFAAKRFDTMLFSHVLEHLREPADVLSRFADLLEPGGMILIAVPNIVVWRQRIRFLFGGFDYEPVGLMDETHLRFMTFRTVEAVLLSAAPDLRVIDKGVQGSVPLWWLRRHVLPSGWSQAIDRWGERHYPNLFGGQILLKVLKP
ncbi:class I SAM-dependent methyltransferase [Amorphus coralli]|uniref:class I SAM-dependent methyltransferase n=1 Tax=Amorphus coralli TaxID=340680 RepID=UPI00036F31E0|nr:class I SAM-dependent methyltransferase [Amorphus coralli]